MHRLSAVSQLVDMTEPNGTLVAPLFDEEEISGLEMDGLTVPDFFMNPPPIEMPEGQAPMRDTAPSAAGQHVPPTALETLRPPGLVPVADAVADRSRSREMVRGPMQGPSADDPFDLSLELSRVLDEHQELVQCEKMFVKNLKIRKAV